MARLRHADKDGTPGRKRTHGPLVSEPNKSLPILQKDVLRHLPIQAKLELGRAIEKSLEGNPDIGEARMRILESMLGREHLEQMAGIKTEMEGICRALGESTVQVQLLYRALRLEGGIPAYLLHNEVVSPLREMDEVQRTIFAMKHGLLGNRPHKKIEIARNLGIQSGRVSEKLHSVLIHLYDKMDYLWSGFELYSYPPFGERMPLTLLDFGIEKAENLASLAVLSGSEYGVHDYRSSIIAAHLAETPFGIAEDGTVLYYRKFMPPAELRLSSLLLHISSLRISIDDVIKLEMAGICRVCDLLAYSEADLKGMGFAPSSRSSIYRGLKEFGFSLKQEGSKETQDARWDEFIRNRQSVTLLFRLFRITREMDYLPKISRKKLGDDEVFTLARLIAYGREKLLKIPGIGKKNLAEIERRLAQYGLGFDMRGSEMVESACDPAMWSPEPKCP